MRIHEENGCPERERNIQIVTSAATQQSNARPPSRLLTLAEPGRAMGELASFYALRPLMGQLPKGDGHGVLVLPGFEFTATFGFHILGIFAPDTPVRQIEHGDLPPDPHFVHD